MFSRMVVFQNYREMEDSLQGDLILLGKVLFIYSFSCMNLLSSCSLANKQYFYTMHHNIVPSRKIKLNLVVQKCDTV